MRENSCYASLGKLLLLRVAAAASLAACVWAQDSDDHDHHHHHHNHGHDDGDERNTLVITILKFYAIVTGVALLLLALGAIAFACCSVCCFRSGKGKDKDIVEGDSEAITNKDGSDDCKLGPRKVGGVICATLCWPVVVAGFGCTAVLKLGDTLKRCNVVGGRSNSEVGGSSAKEAAVGDSPKIDRDFSEKTPPISVVEEGGIDSIELDFL